MISYDIDTQPSQGGSPVYVALADNKVVAIHKAHRQKDNLNVGVLITN